MTANMFSRVAVLAALVWVLNFLDGAAFAQTLDGKLVPSATPTPSSWRPRAVASLSA